jgi:hypothetical protein
MITTPLSTEDLTKVRLASNPLWETVTSFGALLHHGRHTVHAPWTTRVRRVLPGTELSPCSGFSTRPAEPLDCGRLLTTDHPQLAPWVPLKPLVCKMLDAHFRESPQRVEKLDPDTFIGCVDRSRDPKSAFLVDCG